MGVGEMGVGKTGVGETGIPPLNLGVKAIGCRIFGCFTVLYGIKLFQSTSILVDLLTVSLVSSWTTYTC